jgi:hypothetical protein
MPLSVFSRFNDILPKINFFASQFSKSATNMSSLQLNTAIWG